MAAKIMTCERSAGQVFFSTSRLSCLIVVVHVLLVSVCALRMGFAWTEVGLLPTGIADWQYGDFNSFRVNPPLVRDWATLPIAITNPGITYFQDSADPRQRMEWDLAREMIDRFGQTSYTWLAIARLSCLPFLVLGMYCASRWAAAIYGRAAGVGTLLIWATSPALIGYGALISGDAQAASMGIVLLYSFRRWLQSQTWPGSARLGVIGGLAILTKASMLLLVLLLPALWIAIKSVEKRSGLACSEGHRLPPMLVTKAGVSACHLFIAAFCLFLTINLCYGFSGSFRRLGSYNFISKVLAGTDGWEERDWSGNRFRGGILEDLPVPLPEDFLIGLDLQKWDFERDRWSYFLGEWRSRGWWWYYLFGIATKTRVGVLGLAVLSLFLMRSRKAQESPWKDEFILVSASILIVVVASQQLGVSRHLRYILPSAPLAIVLVSRSFTVFSGASKGLKAIASFCIAWMITSSLWIFPHSISYFNETLGGPLGADRAYNASNIDWGQDLRYLQRWHDANPHARPLWVKSYLHLISPAKVGIKTKAMPVPVMSTQGPKQREVRDCNFPPGWYAIDRESRLQRSGNYEYLQQFQPVAYAGYGFLIYRITEEDSANLSIQARHLDRRNAR